MLNSEHHCVLHRKQRSNLKSGSNFSEVKLLFTCEEVPFRQVKLIFRALFAVKLLEVISSPSPNCHVNVAATEAAVEDWQGHVSCGGQEG